MTATPIAAADAKRPRAAASCFVAWRKPALVPLVRRAHADEASKSFFMSDRIPSEARRPVANFMQGFAHTFVRTLHVIAQP